MQIWRHVTVDTAMEVGATVDKVGEALARLVADGWTIFSVARASSTARFDIVAYRTAA